MSKISKDSVVIRNGHQDQFFLWLCLIAIALLLPSCSKQTGVVQPTIAVTTTIDLFERRSQVPTINTNLAATPTVSNIFLTPQPASPSLLETELLQAGSTRVTDTDHMEQVYVPAGEFIMGSDDGDAKTSIEGGVAFPENPVSTVYLDSYWIDKFEVSNGQYALCVENGACSPPWAPISATRLNYYSSLEYSSYPVIYVDWAMARTYCGWAGRRLPTEAEWEKAARGTDGRKYPWGDDPVTGERVNFCDINCPKSHANQGQDDGYPDTAPVGSYPAGASPYGALDMAGNVWEWTNTLIQPYPYDSADGREAQESEGQRVWRGGPWSNGWWWMRSSLRYHSVPWYRYSNLGFRCASTE